MFSDGREKLSFFFGVLESVRDSLERCKMVQNSAVKWFWSLKWASGDETITVQELIEGADG